MTKFAFEYFARTTLGGAFNISDQSQLTTAQIERTIAFLKSPASGPDDSRPQQSSIDNVHLELPQHLF